MRWIYKLPLRLRSLFRKGRVEQELDEEMRFHLEKMIEENIASGMTPEEARYAALRQFGNVGAVKEECRDSWGVRMVSELGQDIRYGLRQLRRNPGFTVVAILTLALGIGANTAIFSVVDAVLLRSLPVKDPGELTLLYSGPSTGIGSGDPTIGRWKGVSYAVYQYFVRNNESFQGFGAFRSGRDALEVRWPGKAAKGQNERAEGQLVSGNYFKVLGVSAALGRTLDPGDDTPGAHSVAVISHDYWQEKLHRDPKAVGRAVDLNGAPFTIVGVAPRGFFGVRMYEHPPDFWIPLSFQPQIMQRESFLTRKDVYWLNLLGRLKPGVTRDQAQTVLDVQLRQFLTGELGAKPSKRDQRAIQGAFVQLAPGGTGISYLRFRYSEPLHILMGIVGLLLLVACANAANLLLSRTAARQKEFSVRLVAGATRLRLIRQMLTESTLLALLGAAAGILLADWGVRVLSALLSSDLVLNVTTDPAVLIFTLAASLLTGLVFGLAPALRMSRTNLDQGLKGGTSASGLSLSRLIPALIVFQVAASLVLLAGAGLLGRSLVNLQGQELGFNRDDVLLVKTDPRLAGIKVGDLENLYQQLLDRLNSLPGVQSATIAYYSPMSGSRSTVGVNIPGYTPNSGEGTGADINQVAPNYFETLGIPLLRGRTISPRDTATSPKVAVVNEAFADRFFHGKDPIGRKFYLHSPPGFEIVGIVGNARYGGPDEAPGPFVYVPLSQVSDSFAGDIEVRTVSGAADISAEVRQAIREVDSALPITSVQTLRAQVNDSFREARLVARLSVLFGLLGLILAAVGLYGVISYSVARRTHEIGIRMALGAEKWDVLKMVIGQGLKLVLIGIVIGVAGALGLTRFLASLLYGVKPTDPLTFIAVSLILIAVALVACYIPARRAAKVDPMVALRYE